MHKLDRNFFARETLAVAKEMLGKVLVRKIRNERRGEVAPAIIMGIIVETEAYIGVEDKACHARHGKTKRNQVMWGRAGVAYVYLCMGLHNLLNIITEREEEPAGVLIRRIVPIDQNYQEILDYKNQKFGPGNLTRYMQIDRSLNGIDLVNSEELYIEDIGLKVKDSEIEALPRIGIDYAEEYKEKPWRFKIKK